MVLGITANCGSILSTVRGGATSASGLSVEKESSGSHAIDEGLYSRQLYVLGREAQRRLQSSRMLVVGLSGTGVEVAKNVVLAGVAELALYDPTPVTLSDLATHFYATESDVTTGVSRADACAAHLSSLNPHVKLTVLENEQGDSDSSRSGAAMIERAAALVKSGVFGVTVAVDQPLELQLAMNDAARAVGTVEGAGRGDKIPFSASGASPSAALSTNSVAFIACSARGVFGSIFSDFGEQFVVRDPTGASPQPSLLAELRRVASGHQSNSSSNSSSSSSSGNTDDLVEVTCVDGERHGLSPRQRLQLRDLRWGGESNAVSSAFSTIRATQEPPRSFNVWAEVLHVRNPLTAIVRLIEAPSASPLPSSFSTPPTFQSPQSMWSAPSSVLDALPSSAPVHLLSGGTVMRPKSEEVTLLRFSPLRDVLQRPSVPPPPYKRRRKLETDAQWFERCPPDELAAQESAATVEAAAKAALDEAAAKVLRLESDSHRDNGIHADENSGAVRCADSDHVLAAARRQRGILEERRKKSLPMPVVGCDWEKAANRDRVATVHACWHVALPRFRRAFDGKDPAPAVSPADADAFLEILRGAFAENSIARNETAEDDDHEDENKEAVVVNFGREVKLDEVTARAFVHSCGAGEGGCGGVVPVTSFIGGVAAQEALKALSGVFVPLQQLLFFDAAETLYPLLLPLYEKGEATLTDKGDMRYSSNNGTYEREKNDEDGAVKEEPRERVRVSMVDNFAPRGDRYDGLRAIVGERTLAELQRQKWFIVGAGAIGCELLKNLALLGVGTAGADERKVGSGGGGDSCSSGGLVLTDMDTIERSNLNRQFLFRLTDVGKSKSEAAAAAAIAMSGDRLVVCPLRTSVGPGDSEDGPDAPFSDTFWRSIDGVLTALDNVEARLFVDSRAVRYRRPLIDAGWVLVLVRLSDGTSEAELSTD
jgi:molybdopterin/thiamine biosynthesis adenylyltransferase